MDTYMDATIYVDGEFKSTLYASMLVLLDV